MTKRKTSEKKKGTKDPIPPKECRDDLAHLNTLIIEHATEGICVCHNITGHPYVNFTVWNNRMKDITGYTMEEINESGWYQTLYPYPELQRQAIERMERLREGDNLNNEPWEITRKDGKKRTVSISTSVVRTEKGCVHVLALMNDITEQKRTLDALGKSEKEYRQVFENASDIIFTTDTNGNYHLVNLAGESITGYTVEELQKMNYLDLILPEHRNRVKFHYMRQYLKRIPLTYIEYPFRCKTGDVLWFGQNATFVHEQGTIRGFHFVARDITRQKRTEEKFKEQFTFLETLLDTIPSPVFYKDLQGKYLGCNEAFEQFTGKIREDIVGKTVYEMEPKAIADQFSEQDKELFRKPGIQTYEWKLPDKNGRTRDLLFIKSPFRDIKGNTAGLIGVISDISERKKSEDSLKKAYDQILLRQNAMLNLSEDLMTEIEEREQIEAQLRESEKSLRQYQARLSALASQIALIDEEERRRFANELHDFTGQNLALAKIMLSELESTVYDRDIQGRLKELRQLVEKSVESTRSLTFELSPPILYELGFEAAADWLGEQLLKRYNIMFHFQDDRQPKPLPDNTKVLLYLSLRELIVNIAKHAKAGNATLSIRRQDNDIQVTVSDDGIGLDTSDMDYQIMKASSFGLFSTRERLERLGGKLEIASEPGKGTTVTMVAPLKE